MNKRLLWVDDEIEFLRSHIRFLETRGYVVATARGGDEAVELIENDPEGYDVVLLDKQMPAKSGIVTLDEIKALRPDLPVVMITGHQHSGDAKLLKDKISGYLTKPIDPNHILLECKRIIDSRQQVRSCRIADRYLRVYTENQARLNEYHDAAGLMSMQGSLAAWDVELDGAGGEGVRQMHAGIKSDSGAKFCGCVAANYAGWIKGQPSRPLMAVDITEKFIAPELREGRGVLMVILSGARLDQFAAIEPELKRNFSMESALFLSMLPTVPEYCFTSLLSGCYPDELHSLEPDIFKPSVDIYSPDVIKRLMSRGLAGAGAERVKIVAENAGSVTKSKIARILDKMRKTLSYGAVVIDMAGMTAGGGRSGAAESIDAELRERIRSWFAQSDVFRMMKEACGQSCTVILTSDHGRVFCGRPAEVYETRRSGGNERYMFSPSGECDERTAFIAQDLAHLRLPRGSKSMKCIVAREDHFFADDKSSRHTRAAPGAYRRGGISPQEMVMPVYVCLPKKTAASEELWP